MAKNKSRKNSSNKMPVKDATVNKSASVSDNEAGKRVAVGSPPRKKERDIVYQVVSKRTSDVIKAYITFTYRVFHPGVSARLIIYGLLIFAPGVFFFKDLFWRLFFMGVGLAVILLGLFRQYISLWITKQNDADYKNGTVFTYNFYDTGAEFLKGEEKFSELSRYKDITNFYYDDDFYYLAIQGRDFFVIPKSAFTVGDAKEFEEFIYKKSKHTCRWIPDNFKDRMKKRRAERAVASRNMMK